MVALATDRNNLQGLFTETCFNISDVLIVRIYLLIFLPMLNGSLKFKHHL